MKKSIAIFVCFVMFLAIFAGCAKDNSGATIGVVMPSKNLQRWNQDGENIKKQLQAKGYDVDLRFSNDSIEEQIEQIDDMIDNKVKILVIASIDGPALKDVLQKAADKKIKVISYDRLILDSPNIDYYATFNNFDVGVMQGEFIESALNLANAAGPFNIEIFSGSEDDNNSVDFYGGAMSILQKYFDSGKLVTQSGKTSKADTSIAGWKTESAEARMNELLKSHYQDAKLDAVLSANDSLALGVIFALRAAGYGPGKPFPILTGQDCDKENVKAMLAGEQSMSVFKDTRSLAARTVEMIDDLLVHDTTTVNDTTTYDNGYKIVPTYVCTPVFADKDNYKQILIDSGYYNEADFS